MKRIKLAAISAIILLLVGCGSSDGGTATNADNPNKSPTEQSTFEPSESTLADGTSKGDKGDKGEPGKDGKDAAPVSANMWYDPVAKQYWLIGGNGTQAVARSSCNGAWKVPTKDEVTVANSRGLSSAIAKVYTGANKSYWVSEDNTAMYYSTAQLVITYGTETASNVLGIICAQSI